METLKLKEIRFPLEIDEEGYPVFGGLRISDPDFLRSVFQKLRRVSPELIRSKLVTCLEENMWAWIDAFDAPLVVQDIDFMEDQVIRLHFLGDRMHQVSLNEITEDEWNRFHAYVGEDQIPSVMSRKAQARFLNEYSRRELNHSFARFRDPNFENSIHDTPESDSLSWDKAYQTKNTGWELGSAHPYLKQVLGKTLLGGLLSSAKEVWVPGAGRGHDAVALAEVLGSKVKAFDFSREALKEFESLYDGKIRYQCVDMFELLKQTPNSSVDAVFEHTFFCAISPLRRLEYVNEVKRVLKPGGFWFGVFFLLEHKGGAPYSLTQWELRQFVMDTFQIKEWHRIPESPNQRTHKELWAVLQHT